MRQRDRDVFHLPVRASDAQRQVLLRLQVRARARDVVSFRAVQLQRLRSGAFFELQRQHAHADEVGAMDALEALRHDALSRRAERVPLAAQSRELPVPYSCPAMTINGVVVFGIFHGRIVRCSSARRSAGTSSRRLPRREPSGS